MSSTNKTEIDRLRAWINDLQAGMYINCVYCGHRYGPDDEVPAHAKGVMADVLKEHIATCPEHPLSEANARIAWLEEYAEDVYDCLTDEPPRTKEARSLAKRMIRKPTLAKLTD